MLRHELLHYRLCRSAQEAAVASGVRNKTVHDAFDAHDKGGPRHCILTALRRFANHLVIVRYPLRKGELISWSVGVL